MVGRVSSPPELTVRAATMDDLSEIAELVARSFADDQVRAYERILHFWLASMPERPGFTPEMLRVGLVDGQIVSHAMMRQYTMRYGQAILKVAGVSAVCTHESYRHHGYAAVIMRDLLTYIAEQGAHVSLLHGRVPHYYEKFGYSPVFPKYYFTFSTEDAADLPQYLHVRDAELEDLPIIAALYEKHWGGRVSFQRSPQIWQWRFNNADKPPLVVDDGLGNIDGYLFTKPDGNIEVVADSPEAVTSFLAWSGRWYDARGDSQVTWFVPPDDVIITYARQFLPINISVLYQPTAGWMARLIDTYALVQTLLPELLAHATAIHPALQYQDILFDVQPDRVHIAIRHDPASACELSREDFIQIMFGSLRPSALAARIHLQPVGVELLEMLFPSRMAALAPWDWF